MMYWRFSVQGENKSRKHTQTNLLQRWNTWSNSVDWLQLRLVTEALSAVAADCNEDLSEENLVHYVQCNMPDRQDTSPCAYILLSKWCAWQISRDKNEECVLNLFQTNIDWWFRLRFFGNKIEKTCIKNIMKNAVSQSQRRLGPTGCLGKTGKDDNKVHLLPMQRSGLNA